ncbi:MAG: hypothetical protein JWM63_1949 [Gammaproteobacteria bacterium]|jgi:hypothetical protein|nr:hypothetical protein [Gammaproteobacteria bacterium]
MNGRAAPVFPILLLAVGAPASHAETLYVIEQLVVSVSSAPDTSGERVASIHSGDHVDVLDRQGDEVHVQLANGTAGWIKASYLSSDPPLKLRLAERSAEVEKLKQDVGRLEADLASARVASRAKPNGAPANTSAAPLPSTPAPAAATSTESPPAAIESPPADTATRDPAFFMTPPEQPPRPIWHWVLGSSSVTLGLGFALGWQMLDRRIRRKYGGLRIY